MICRVCASMSLRPCSSATRSFRRCWASVSAVSASASACCSSAVRCAMNSPVCALDPFQGPVAGAPAAQIDERVLAEQRVHRVQEERDVVEVQTARRLLADLEELLADEIEIGDDDDVDVAGCRRLGSRVGCRLGLGRCRLVRCGLLGLLGRLRSGVRPFSRGSRLRRVDRVRRLRGLLLPRLRLRVGILRGGRLLRLGPRFGGLGRFGLRRPRLGRSGRIGSPAGGGLRSPARGGLRGLRGRNRGRSLR